jgi:hypothetical protein
VGSYLAWSDGMPGQDFDLWKEPTQLISDLHAHAGDEAKRLRTWALALTVLAAISFLAAGVVAFRMDDPGEKLLAWAIAKVSVLVVAAAALVFLSRTVWNFSNVWLGRAGTLEDLALALNLLGVTRGGEQRVPSAALRDVTESLERLRRGFEGELLKGPSFEVKMPGKG